MVRNKIIKLSTIIGTLFLIVICFNSPFFIDLSKEKNNMIIKDKLNTKRTVLSSLFNTKANSKLSVYIIWDSYDVKNLPKEIPHHKILYTKNNYLIKRLLQVSFLTYSSFCRMESSLTTDIHWCSHQFKRFRDISTFEIVQ